MWPEDVVVCEPDHLDPRSSRAPTTKKGPGRLSKRRIPQMIKATWKRFFGSPLHKVEKKVTIDIEPVSLPEESSRVVEPHLPSDSDSTVVSDSEVN